jgi:hypothetical protein
MLSWLKQLSPNISRSKTRAPPVARLPSASASDTTHEVISPGAMRELCLPRIAHHSPAQTRGWGDNTACARPHCAVHASPSPLPSPSAHRILLVPGRPARNKPESSPAPGGDYSFARRHPGSPPPPFAGRPRTRVHAAGSPLPLRRARSTRIAPPAWPGIRWRAKARASRAAAFCGSAHA